MHCVGLLSPYSRDPCSSKVHPKGPDIMRQLHDKQCSLDFTYLVSCPVSLHLIRLVRLARCFVTCKILDKESGGLSAELAGSIQYSTSGHSQSIVSTAAIASASTWISFHHSRPTLSLSFFGSVAVPSKLSPTELFLLIFSAPRGKAIRQNYVTAFETGQTNQKWSSRM